MSNTELAPVYEPKDILDHFRDEVAHFQDIDTKKREIEKHRVNKNYKNLLDTKEQEQKIKKLKVDSHLSKKDVEELKLRLEQNITISLKTNILRFCLPDEFTPGMNTTTLVCAPSGGGKSTVVSNCISEAIDQNVKALLISTEENKDSHILRVASTRAGLGFNGIHTVTEENKDIILSEIDVISESFKCIDDSYGGVSGLTTTHEGLEHLFSKVSKDTCDVIIVDYLQAVTSSKNNPTIRSWEAQARFIEMLEKFREKVGVPIILFAQIKPEDDKDKGANSAKDRIIGSKSIYERSTAIIEMIPSFQHMSTKFVVRKSRFYGHLMGKHFVSQISLGMFSRIQEESIDE